MILNFIAIILAMLGILNPVVGALVHNAGSVLVIITRPSCSNGSADQLNADCCMKNGLMHRCGASAQFVKDNGVGGSKIMLGNDEML